MLKRHKLEDFKVGDKVRTTWRNPYEGSTRVGVVENLGGMIPYTKTPGITVKWSDGSRFAPYSENLNPQELLIIGSELELEYLKVTEDLNNIFREIKVLGNSLVALNKEYGFKSFPGLDLYSMVDCMQMADPGNGWSYSSIDC